MTSAIIILTLYILGALTMATAIAGVLSPHRTETVGVMGWLLIAFWPLGILAGFAGAAIDWARKRYV